MVRATSARRTDAPGVLTASRITRWEVGARNRSGRVPASHGVGMLQRRPPAETCRRAAADCRDQRLTATARGHRGTGRREVSAGWRSMSAHRAMRPARGDRSKNVPQARPAAEALIRHRDSDHPAAQLIERRLAHNPGRSGDRKAIAGGTLFRASGRGAMGRNASPPLPANHRPPNSQWHGVFGSWWSFWELGFLGVGS